MLQITKGAVNHDSIFRYRSESRMPKILNFSSSPFFLDMLRRLKPIYLRCLNSRSFSVQYPSRKKVSTVRLSDLVIQTNINSTKALEKKEISTGSVVLDTVREYSKKYPLCVLLVQVGDFYEVRAQLFPKKENIHPSLLVV